MPAKLSPTQNTALPPSSHPQAELSGIRIQAEGFSKFYGPATPRLAQLVLHWRLAPSSQCAKLIFSSLPRTVARFALFLGGVCRDYRCRPL